ncbi:alpha/beta fold hydrolase [Arhodomonas sp. AD133]|uniref:alpha/beta fold hydrolase n=1 Tax=Arhodomonas sp. AD133 TaxID=3415009 RepID=UPI003EBA44D6
MLTGLDWYRRHWGQVCDILGLGPRETAHDILDTGTPARLYRYAASAARGPVVVLVPAPIKSPDIWDLDPEISVVRRHLEQGSRVCLVAWPRTFSDADAFGLGDYVAWMLGACIDTVCRDAGEERVFINAHSIGGTLAALYSARYPDRVKGLVVLASPLHFGPDIGALGRFVSRFPDTDALIGGNAIPGSLLNLLSATASPQAFIVQRTNDWLASLTDAGQLRRHLIVERWTLDETPMPRQLFLDLVERLYRRDGFARGEVRIDGQRVTPADVRCPVMCVVSRHCDITPPEAVLPVLEAFGTADREVLWYTDEPGVSLQHVGVLAGVNAHRHLWPHLLTWMRNRQASATAHQ